MIEKAASLALLPLAAALAGGGALAADLPSRKPPPPIAEIAPAPLWNGFYAGVNAGHGWGATNGAATSSLPVFDAIAVLANGFDPPNIAAGGLTPGAPALAGAGVARVEQSGFVGGGQVGYNFRAGQNFVLGLEADFQGAMLRGKGGYAGVARDSIQWNDGPGAHPCGPAVNCLLDRTAVGVGSVTAGVDWLGTARARLGYLLTPDLLLYGTGGFAYGGVHASATHAAVTQGVMTNLNSPFDNFNGVYVLTPVPGAARMSGLRTGWAAGGGGEWMFAPNWSLRVEALYYDLGSVSLSASPVAALSPVTLAAPGGIAVAAGQPLAAALPSTRIRFDGVIARAGVNFHFGAGAPPPAVAKY